MKKVYCAIKDKMVYFTNNEIYSGDFENPNMKVKGLEKCSEGGRDPECILNTGICPLRKEK